LKPLAGLAGFRKLVEKIKMSQEPPSAPTQKKDNDK